MMKDSLKKSLERRLDKGRKQGFTLVELLVVIAIIAVLATVSVVGYLGFTKKAKVSNDISLTTQMNTALDANRAIAKNNTMSDAVEDLADAGLDVEKLSPTADGYSYVWDMKQDLMFLLDEKKNVVAPSDKTISDNKEVFAVIHSDDQRKTWEDYAQYIAADYPEQEISYELLTSVDTGKSDVKDVKISSSDNGTSVIRMNGGTLTFDDASADAYFYGNANKVKVDSVANNSFHVLGNVGDLEVKSGHIVLESGSSTDSVVATTSSVSLSEAKGSKVGTVGYTNEKPSTFPADAEIVDSITYNMFAGGLGTEKSPYLINSLEQWENLAENSKAKDSLGAQGKYFSVLCDLDFKDADKLIGINYFSGNITFNNHNVKNLPIDNEKGIMVSQCYGVLFKFVYGESKISDLNVTLHYLKPDIATKIVAFTVNPFSSNESGDVVLENITTDGSVSFTDNNTGVFVYWAGQGKLTLKNCTNNATVINTGYTGVFVGRVYCNNVNPESYCTNLYFENCINNGLIINSNDKSETRILLSNHAGLGSYNNYV